MMFALSNKDLQARYEAMSLNLNINVEPKGYLSYRDSKPLFGIRLDVPSEGPKVALLAYSLLAFEGDDFCGALLWFTSWDIGTPQIERCGLKLLEQMRRGYGVTPSVENAPAQFFRTDESVDAQAFLTLPLIFGWDVYFMPHGTRYFAYARQNGSLFLVTDQEEVSQKLLAFFEKRHPVPELPSYLRSAQQTL